MMVHAPFNTTPGTRDPQALTAKAPIFDASLVKAEPVTVPEAEIFHTLIEVDDRLVLPLIPPALHTPLPPMASFVLWVCRDSSIGPFKLAQLRVFARLLARPRGLLLGSHFEGAADAAEYLRKHWGFDCTPGRVTVRAYSDQVVGTVEAQGRQVLRVSGRDPHAIAPQDVRDMPNCNPVRLRRPEGEYSRLLQVDVEVVLKEATRSIHPMLEQIDGDAWHAPGLRQEYPVRSLHCRGALRLPPPRFLIDPALPTDQRSEEIR